MTLHYLNNTYFRVAALLIGLALFPVVVDAQISQSFSLSPTIFNVEAEPGQEWKTSLRLINTNAYPLDISVQLRDFLPSAEGDTPQFLIPEESATSSFANWIETETTVTVPPEQTYELPIVVSVPAKAEPGGHFAAILISTQALGETNTTGVGTSQAISSLLFLRVAGDVSEVATIRSFRTSDYLVSNPVADFELRIENIGNVHLQPQGEIVIYNMWGQERGIIPINKQSLFGNVLPDSVRNYRFTWIGEWSISDIGKYTAEAVLTYGSNGKKTIFSETTFWFVPWKWLLLVVFFIISFVLLIRFAIRKYIQRMFALSGVMPQGARNQISTVEEPELEVRKVSVIAPLEAGLLDLRAGLNKASLEDESQFKIVLDFVRQQKLFFGVIAAIILFTAVVTWFITSALSPDRDFVITTDDGNSTTAEEARALRNPPELQNPIAPADGKFLTVINRSGDTQTSERISRLLTGGKHTVTASEFDPNAIEPRTVVVYPVSETERALEISKLLNESPISALSESEARSNEIIIYVGSDALNW